MDTKLINPEDKNLTNLASKWTPEDRRKIASEVCQNYDTDKSGREEWEDKRNKWFRLWLGLREPKHTPFENASNVCLPMLAIACNQFHARSYQAFFAPPQLVKVMPVAELDMGRARNVERFMNWQVMEEMDEFEDEHDRLLLNIPISGTSFVKGYYDRENERPRSEYVSAMDVVLPFRTRNMNEARRVTHTIWRHYDEMKMKNDRVRGFYIDFDKVQSSAGQEPDEDLEKTKDEIETMAFSTEERPKLLLEQHCWSKAPGDDTMKPYIFWVDYDSHTLLRATSRFIDAGKKQVVANYFVDYHFLPNPEGFYSFGFGHFLETLNEMANTAFNQIFDAGRLSNQPFGFYGRRAGLKKREIKLEPGKMIEVEDATQVFFPTMQRVDQVLFQVLGLIQQYSEQFTSTSDYLLGREAKGVKNPTATGTQAIIEQGLILYSVMIKRLFRAFKKELRMVFMLDQLFLPETKQYRVVEKEDRIAFPTAKREDFDGKMDVIPMGDPSYASRLTRRQEAQEIYTGLLNNPLVGFANPQMGPPANPKAIWRVTRAWLETFERKDIDKLLPELPPEPMNPETENAMFMQGDDHDPINGEDHNSHLKAHMLFRAGPFFSDMSPERQALVSRHIDKTIAMLYQETVSKNMMGNVPGAMPSGPSTPVGAPPNATPPASPVSSPAAPIGPAGPMMGGPPNGANGGV